MASERSTVLFICTGNSARSLMAEAIANQKFAKYLEACSAGSQPEGEPHPLTLQILQKNAVQTEGLQPKSWHEFADRSFDLIITLCDSAKDESCPNFPGHPPTVHWSLPDPASDASPDLFEGIYESLVEAIGFMVHGPNPALAGRANEAGRVLTRRFAPRAI